MCAKAERTAAEIRDGMRRILVEEQLAVGRLRRVLVVPDLPEPDREAIDPATFDPRKLGFKAEGRAHPDLAYRLRVALIANGVDVMGAPGGLVSATHGAREVAQTLEAFRTAVRWLKAEGDV